MNLNLEDLNNLDLSNMGDWPVVAKVLVVISLIAAVVGAGYWFHLQHELEELNRLQAEESELKREFRGKQHRAANLGAYQEQLESIHDQFGELLRKLPDRTEMAELLVDISQTGLAAGLDFEVFRPEQDRLDEFYVEVPVRIRVTGTYHQFGDFASGLAELPRIVTLHDFTIERAGRGENRAQLVMDLSARTYRYIED